MDVPSIKIIWCDVSFEKEDSYRSITDEFNETTTATERKPMDPMDTLILDEGKEELRSNDVPLITVRTADDAFREIEQNKDKNIFVICSGSVGRYLVPEMALRYPLVHKIYIYTHNILIHVDWADNYIKMVRMFDFHTNLLVRLTRDISYHFIEQGRMLLRCDAPREARTYFIHAQNLEYAANRRDTIALNLHEMDHDSFHPEFREHLDLLEGEHGLISQAEDAMRQQEHSLETF